MARGPWALDSGGFSELSLYGRWTVTADYQLGEIKRRAAFTFDQQARFSVSANDEARWLLGEQTARSPQAGRRHNR